jgi:hypothetical protein
LKRKNKVSKITEKEKLFLLASKPLDKDERKYHTKYIWRFQTHGRLFVQATQYMAGEVKDRGCN